MNLKTIGILVGMLPFIIGCVSTTPGDAAYKSANYEQAANLYAKQENKLAALKLGLMIQNKKISTKNHGTALKWYIKACELGSNKGCHNSGYSYEYAKNGAIKDYNKARTYYTISAKRNFIQSQYNLGTLYSNNYFINDIEGLKWILISKKSAENCLNNSVCQWVKKDPPSHQNKLENRMNKNQINSAKKNVKLWKY